MSITRACSSRPRAGGLGGWPRAARVVATLTGTVLLAAACDCRYSRLGASGFGELPPQAAASSTVPVSVATTRAARGQPPRPPARGRLLRALVMLISTVPPSS